MNTSKADGALPNGIGSATFGRPASSPGPGRSCCRLGMPSGPVPAGPFPGPLAGPGPGAGMGMGMGMGGRACAPRSIRSGSIPCERRSGPEMRTAGV